MKRYIYFFTFLIFFCWTSCQDEKVSGRLTKVDYLLNRVDSVESTLTQTDTVAANANIKTVGELLGYIQKNYHDTMTKQTGFLMSDFHGSRKSFKRLLENYHKEYKELKYTRNQLNDLRSDITNQILNDTTFNRYYSAEKNAVDRLYESVQNLSVWEASCKKHFNQRYLPVRELVEKLKAGKEE